MTIYGDTAIWTLTGIPIGLGGASWTTPPFILFHEPGIHTDLFLTANVFQNFSVVRQTIVIEARHQLTWEISTLRAAGKPLSESAIAYLALPA
jgi:hypothetical protein